MNFKSRIHSFFRRAARGSKPLRGGNPKYLEPRLRDLVGKEAALLGRHVANGTLVLDAGCGDGRNAFRLLDELCLQPRHICLADISAENLAQARCAIAADPRSSHLFSALGASLFSLPLAAARFDCALCLGDVLCVASAGSIAEGLVELRRVVRPSGIILFSLVTKDYLLRFASLHGRQDKLREIEATDTYTEWNHTFGEGVFRCWGAAEEIPRRLGALGLALIELLPVQIDYPDIAARYLIACRKLP